jgi:hypothetical protein
MEIILYSLIILLGYVGIVFFGLRLIAPFMGFNMYSLPKNLSKDILDTVSDLEKQSNSQMSFLQNVYNFVLEKNLKQWKHSRFGAGLNFHRLWVKDINEIWHTRGFVYCTGINFVVVNLLVQSRFFKSEDIKIKHTFANFVPHQYLQVKVAGVWIDVDPAEVGASFGAIG